MTTRVHIVNLGPDAIEIHTPTDTPVKLYEHQDQNFYVYGEQDITIKEVKIEKKERTGSSLDR